MPNPPTGTISFLFTDIEGSTQRWQRFPSAMPAAVARHDALLRTAIEAHHGYVFKTVGDAFCAALAAQRRLTAESWGETGPIRARMALHAGQAEERDGDYFGPTVNRVARLLSAGYGGQTLLSRTAQELLQDTLPDHISLRDLGEHRLKDLARSERVFQLVVADLPNDFPPLKTLDHQPTNLPVQLTPFVGREREVAALRDLFLRPEVRLVTLTGPGGTGKTRLGLQVAAELIDAFDDGVFFVDLAPIGDPSLVVPTIAQTLGIREAGGQSLVTTLAEFLRGRNLLLLLDNFEQVTDAATAVADLLRACPRLSTLVTSRHVLHVSGERELAVTPLALPDRSHLPPADQVTRYEAVQLFVERAQAANADFVVSDDNVAAVVEICERLDGLPLAIELAAARVKLLTPQAMLARLERRLQLLTGDPRDLPSRQQTLRNTIAWSHDLLSSDEQLLFRRLGVFIGGWTLDAAEAVCNPDGDLDVLNGLASLADKSLVRQQEQVDGAPRFAMLETIREFALEHLAATAGGEEALLRLHHAERFLALAEEANAALTGPEQGVWLRRLEADYDNLRAAFASLMESEQVEEALRLAAALWRFWRTRGRIGEGRAWLGQALARAEHVAPEARAKALTPAGILAWAQGDYRPAETLLEEALAIWRMLGHLGGIASTSTSLGLVAADLGDYDRADSLHEASLAAERELGNTRGAASALTNLGLVAERRGQYDRAEAAYEEALGLHRTLGDAWGEALLLNNLGGMAYHRGNDDRATALYEEALTRQRALGDRPGVARALSNLGGMAHHRGDYAKATALWEESLALRLELGDRWGVANVRSNLGGLALAQGDSTRAASLLGQSLAEWWQQGERRGAAVALINLAACISQAGRAEAAARVVGTATALLDAIGTSLAPREREEQAMAESSLRDELGEDAFVAAWDAGRALPPEEAVAEALAIADELGATDPN